MKKNEFNEVINALNIYNPEYIDKDKKAEVHTWNNLELLFAGNFAIVRGKIPLEVANNIYNKYDNNKFGIRLNSLINNPKPIDQAIDDIYINSLTKLQNKDLNLTQLIKRGKLIKKEFERRDNKNKYINNYHIDTKEGLIIFITEYLNYIDNIKDNNKELIKNK